MTEYASNKNGMVLKVIGVYSVHLLYSGVHMLVSFAGDLHQPLLVLT